MVISLLLLFFYVALADEENKAERGAAYCKELSKNEQTCRMGGCCAYNEGENECEFTNLQNDCKDQRWTDLKDTQDLAIWKKRHMRAANRTGVLLFLLTFMKGNRKYDATDADMALNRQQMMDPNYMRTKNTLALKQQQWAHQLGLEEQIPIPFAVSHDKRVGISAGCYNAEHASYMGMEDKWNHACLIITKTHPLHTKHTRSELSTFSKSGPKGLAYVPTFSDDIEKFFLEHIGWDFFPQAKEEL